MPIGWVGSDWGLGWRASWAVHGSVHGSIYGWCMGGAWLVGGFHKWCVIQPGLGLGGGGLVMVIYVHRKTSTFVQTKVAPPLSPILLPILYVFMSQCFSLSIGFKKSRAKLLMSSLWPVLLCVDFYDYYLSIFNPRPLSVYVFSPILNLF